MGLSFKNNQSHHDYQYNEDNKSLDFNIDSEIENIGKMNIMFNINNVFLSSLTNNFLSNKFKVKTINKDDFFKKINRIDNITITLNNDQFLTSFASFLAFSEPEKELEFFEYKFNEQYLINFKNKLSNKIIEIKKQNNKHYKTYLKPIQDSLDNNKG